MVLFLENVLKLHFKVFSSCVILLLSGETSVLSVIYPVSLPCCWDRPICAVAHPQPAPHCALGVEGGGLAALVLPAEAPLPLPPPQTLGILI